MVYIKKGKKLRSPKKIKSHGLCRKYSQLTIYDALVAEFQLLIDDIHANKQIVRIRRSRKAVNGIFTTQHCSHYLMAFILKNCFDDSEKLCDLGNVDMKLSTRMQYRRLKEHLIYDACFQILFNDSMRGTERIEKPEARVVFDGITENKIDGYNCIHNWKPKAKVNNTSVSTLLKGKMAAFVNLLEYKNVLQIYPSILIMLLNTSYLQHFEPQNKKVEQEDFMVNIPPCQPYEIGDFIFEIPEKYSWYHIELKTAQTEKLLKRLIENSYKNDYVMSCLIEPPNSKAARELKMQIDKLSKNITRIENSIIKYQPKEPCFIVEHGESEQDTLSATHMNNMAEIEKLRKYHFIDHINLATYECFISMINNSTLYIGDLLVESHKAYSVYHFNRTTRLVDLAMLSNSLPGAAAFLYGFDTKVFMMKIRDKVMEKDEFAKEEYAKSLEEECVEITVTDWPVINNDSGILKFNSVDFCDVNILNHIVFKLAELIKEEKLMFNERDVHNRYNSYCDLVIGKDFYSLIDKSNVCEFLTGIERMKYTIQKEFFRTASLI